MIHQLCKEHYCDEEQLLQIMVIAEWTRRGDMQRWLEHQRMVRELANED